MTLSSTNWHLRIWPLQSAKSFHRNLAMELNGISSFKIHVLMLYCNNLHTFILHFYASFSASVMQLALSCCVCKWFFKSFGVSLSANTYSEQCVQTANAIVHSYLQRMSVSEGGVNSVAVSEELALSAPFAGSWAWREIWRRIVRGGHLSSSDSQPGASPRQRRGSRDRG